MEGTKETWQSMKHGIRNRILEQEKDISIKIEEIQISYVI